MDKRHIVIYCGTFSKVLFPGIRIGWVAAEKECIERLMAIRSFSDLSSSMILQAGVYEFCQQGYYDCHVNKMHRFFRKRMQTILTALDRYILPEWAEWREPSGGYLVWIKLKFPVLAEEKLDKFFTVHGIQVKVTNHFFSSEEKGTYLRLSISMLNEAEITAGIQRLAQALEQFYARHRLKK